MEADLYDEFGNYIGPELDSDEESEDEDEIGEEEVAEYVSRVGFWTQLGWMWVFSLWVRACFNVIFTSL